MTMPEWILLTIIIASFLVWITKKDNRALNTMLVFMLMMAALNLFTTTRLKRTNELIVYNSPSEIVIGIRTGKTMTVFSSDSILNTDVNKHCATLGLRHKLTKLNDTPAYIEVGSKKIVVTDEINDYILENSTPDFVILTGQRPVIKNNDFQGQIIISSSVPQRFRIDDTKAVHYTRTSGAYQTKL